MLSYVALVAFCVQHVTAQEKINNVIVLMLENRPFDHIFGWYGDNVNGLSGDEFNYVDPNNTASEKIFVDDECPYLNSCDPSHGTSPTTFKIFSGGDEYETSPNNGGFVSYEKDHANYCNVMSGFSPDKLPVINSLAKEFALMDRFFASHPGPTWPNRMYTLSATSAGSLETGTWYHDVPGALFPQRTLFDQLEEQGRSWKNYYNDTPWELFMDKIAHSRDHLRPLDEFFVDASSGNLPSFSWINPRSGINITSGIGSNDQHPDHDMNAGEQYIKDIYESVRASPQWNETLLIITYDEHGGFYDHVTPPDVDIPAPNDGEVSYPGEGFQFNRLGLRIPTLLISPWIAKNTIVSGPPDSAKPFPSSEFDLTSIMASTRKLLGMDETALTDRDAWAAVFDYVLDEAVPRSDCPIHLPDALPPQVPDIPEELLPLNELQVDIASVHAFLAGVTYPTPAHTVQGDHSEWARKHFDLHKSNILQRQDILSYQSEYSVVTMSKTLYRDIDSFYFYFNGLPYGGNPEYANNTMPYITLSSRDISVDIETSVGMSVSVPLCMDAGDGTEGSVLTATPCFPSINPAYNQAPSQHFVLNNDGLLQYFDARLVSTPDQFLCVTNHHPEELEADTLVTSLQKCSGVAGGVVDQSWAVRGVAPGDGDKNYLLYGDAGNALGLRKNN